MSFRPSATRSGLPPAARRGTGGRGAQDRLEQERGVRRRGLFLAMLGIVLVVAATNVLLGALGLLQETRSRPLTEAERAAYVKDDVARRWHILPAESVFPESLGYTALGRSREYAHRVGIAPESSCRGGLDSPVAATLDEYGCRTLLRATYVDQSASYAITIGVAVLKDEDARLEAAARLPVDDRVGVRPVSFPRTVTQSFGAAQRQRSGWIGAGPYIILSTAGYTDGRTRDAVGPEEILHSELWPTAQAIAGHIARVLSEPPDVPRCTQGNVC